jgi:hypothetical protein
MKESAREYNILMRIIEAFASVIELGSLVEPCGGDVFG